MHRVADDVWLPPGDEPAGNHGVHTSQLDRVFRVEWDAALSPTWDASVLGNVPWTFTQTVSEPGIWQAELHGQGQSTADETTGLASWLPSYTELISGFGSEFAAIGNIEVIGGGTAGGGAIALDASTSTDVNQWSGPIYGRVDSIWSENSVSFDDINSEGVWAEFTNRLGVGLKGTLNGMLDSSLAALTPLGNLDLRFDVTEEDAANGYYTNYGVTLGSIEVVTLFFGGFLATGGKIAKTAGRALDIADAAQDLAGVVEAGQQLAGAIQNPNNPNGPGVGEALLGLAGAIGVAALGAVGNVRSSAATPSGAVSKNYKKTFFDAHPHLEGKVVVHHSVEQQVLNRYPGMFSEAEIHSLKNLRGIPKSINPDVHLSTIRKEWNTFYDAHQGATRQQILDEAARIDRLLGWQFEPPI